MAILQDSYTTSSAAFAPTVLRPGPASVYYTCSPVPECIVSVVSERNVSVVSDIGSARPGTGYAFVQTSNRWGLDPLGPLDSAPTRVRRIAD